MFHASKILLIKFGAGFLLTSLLSPSLAFSEEAGDSSWDSLDFFHEDERPNSLVDSFLIESLPEKIKIKIYLINQDEPYNSPLSFRIFSQCNDGSIGELKRVLVDHSHPTYCQTGEPEIMQNPEFFGSNKRFLVVPAYSFDDQRGECAMEQESLEVYPLDEISRSCSY